MIKIKYNNLKLFALLILALPILIFFLSWIKLIVGIPFSILLLFAIGLSYKKNDEREISIKTSTLLVVILIVTVWAILSGQGEIFTQKRDFEYRNVIFRDLINYNWPVLYGDELDTGLTYYIGFWLLPALIGKLGVSIGGFALGWTIAQIAVVFWTVTMIVTMFLLLFQYFNFSGLKSIILMIGIVIVFSGMDILGAVISCPDLLNEHIEWWGKNYQYSSMSTQLCWVFNQAVPAWLAISLFINEKNASNYALIGLLIILSSPLPLVGLAVFMVAFAIRDLIKKIKQKDIKTFFKNTLTVQNIIALLTIAPIFFLYYKVNSVSSSGGVAGVNSGLRFDFGDVFTGIPEIIWYVIFLFLEFLILTIVICEKKNLFNSILVILQLTFFPFILVGNSTDFQMRASIPALFILMIMTIEYLHNYFKEFKQKNIENPKRALTRKRKVFTVLIILIIGMVTPFVEYYSSFSHYIQSNGESATQYDYMNSLADVKIQKKRNFVCENAQESLFYKYFVK